MFTYEDRRAGRHVFDCEDEIGGGRLRRRWAAQVAALRIATHEDGICSRGCWHDDRYGHAAGCGCCRFHFVRPKCSAGRAEHD